MIRRKVLLAGASGALGYEVLKQLVEQGHQVRALVHSEQGESRVRTLTPDVVRADASDSPQELHGICDGIQLVISALGKSVSLFTHRGESFLESDFYANNNILEDARKAGVERFIYVSIKGADQASEFEIPKAHKMFEDALKSSGIAHTIIRPVGFFSGLNDLAIMAKRKLIPIVGDGSARTNSIHQRDLASVVMDYIEEGPELIEVGGPLIHTRKEMAEMIKSSIGGNIVEIPEKIADWGMILPELVDDDFSAKLKYFKYVTTRDMIGERKGQISFQEYLDNLDLKELP